ncbi:MAG: FAD:protein FMN transferase, partial [Lachnospiraceae bacterium]|nr:FAD:protein FMN transferase [Lachnospiraceae bacterium]
MILISALSTYACSLRENTRNSEKSGDNTGFSTVRASDRLTASFFAFDTYMKITVYEDENGPVDESDLKSLADEALRLEKIFSTTDKESEIYRFNNRAADRVTVSEEAISLFDRTKEIYERTDGALDATAYPLVKAW